MTIYEDYRDLSDQADYATMRGAVCAATAAGVSWALGSSVTQTAALAALSGFLLAEGGGKKRVIAGAVLPSLLFAVGHRIGWLDIGRKGLCATYLGTAGGTYLWERSPSRELVDHRVRRHHNVPTPLYPLIGLGIGVLRPFGLTPFHLAIALGGQQLATLAYLHTSINLENIADQLGEENRWTKELKDFLNDKVVSGLIYVGISNVACKRIPEHFGFAMTWQQSLAVTAIHTLIPHLQPPDGK